MTSSGATGFPEIGYSSFLHTARGRKYKTRRPTSQEKGSHIDIILTGLKKKKRVSSITIDLKSCSSLKKCSNKWQWIELRNPAGRPGWLYDEADFIVFERKNDFVLVNRKNLVRWVNIFNKIRFDLPFVKNSWEAKYRLYKRPNKKESITQIQVDDLLQINETHIWKKIKEKT